MATLSLLASAAWDGTITIYDFHNQSHIFAAAVSLGLAIASGLCLYVSFSLSRPHLGAALLAVLGLIAIGLLFVADWPVAVYYVYFDIAKLLAIYIAIGLVPSLLVALFPPRNRKYWHATIPYAILAMMAVYVTVRSSQIYCACSRFNVINVAKNWTIYRQSNLNARNVEKQATSLRPSTARLRIARNAMRSWMSAELIGRKTLTSVVTTTTNRLKFLLTMHWMPHQRLINLATGLRQLRHTRT